MFLERNPKSSEAGSIKDHINSQDASLVMIADFYVRLAKKEYLIKPKLKNHELAKIIASNLPERINDDIKQKALEAVVSQDKETRLIGERAVDVLFSKTFSTVFEANLDRQMDADEVKRGMWSSARTFVLKNATKIIERKNRSKKFQISTEVNDVAQMGTFWYLSKKYRVPLYQRNHSLGISGVLLLREIVKLRATEKPEYDDVVKVEKEYSWKTGVSFPDLLDLIVFDRRFPARKR
jgi:hypothetical protein